MPELPEVETIARQLQPLIRGARLERVTVLDRKIGSCDAHGVVGEVRRLGKQVVFVLRTGTYIAVHLRMTGRLIWCGRQRIDSEHLLSRRQGQARTPRVVFEFNRGTLEFHDLRRFGTVRCGRSLAALAPAGIDPLSREFTPAVLTELLKSSRQAMKQWLLRQDRLVGIGNIYASEILFRAGIGPRRRGSTLRAKEIARLYEAIRSVLTKAVKWCGTTFSDFRDGYGERGGFQRFLAVYDREGRGCRRCRAPIKRIVQNARSTYFCPSCQRGH